MNKNYKINQDYKKLPRDSYGISKYSEYHEIVFSRSNNKSKFYAIVFDKLTYEPFNIFYSDDNNLILYFELTQPVFEKFLNDKRYKIEKISETENWYEFIHPNLIEKVKPTISTQQSSTTIKSNTSSNKQIIELKAKLEKINPILLPQIRIFKHKKKNITKINFMIDDLIVYVPNELKDSVEELLKSLQSNNQEQSKTTQVNNNIENNKLESPKIETIATYDIFKINYTNSDENRIKDVLKAIPIDKLQDLKLYELDPNKKDKFDKSIKTNFKNYKAKPILYYQLTDLPIIKRFFKLTKKGYDVKYCRKDRKQIICNNKRITLSNKNRIIENNIDYYIQLDGKIYYYLILFDNNNPKNNKKLVIDHNNDLSNSQKLEIQTAYKRLENENIEIKFNKMFELLTKFIN
jgi:hypothetical protein